MYTLDLSLPSSSTEGRGSKQDKELKKRQKKQLQGLKIFLSQLFRQNAALYPSNRFMLAVESENKVLMAQLMVVCWSLPITLFPLPPELPDSYKDALLYLTGSKLLLLDQMEANNGRAFADDIRIIDTAQLWLDDDRASDEAKLEGQYNPLENPIKLIIATSGTTDSPKAVYLTEENILAHFAAARNCINLNASNHWLNVLPLYHVGGAMIVYRTLLAQARMSLLPGFDAEQVWEILFKEKISHLSLVPLMLEKLLLEKSLTEKSRLHNNEPVGSSSLKPPASLKTILIGGSAIRESLYHQAHRLAWPIHISYGSSESCSFITLDRDYRPDYIAGQCGQPIKQVHIRIDTETSPGLIRLKGPMIMSGYANRNYQLGVGLQRGWYTSSDMGVWDNSGRLQILGRADQQINSGGEKLDPRLLEQELTNCPGITDAAVLADSDPIWGERVVLIYCGKWAESLVRQWCQQFLRKQFKPKLIYQVAALPRNSMGKLQSRELSAILEERKRFSSPD